MDEVTTTKHAVTAEELAAMPDDGMRRELVRGEVRVMPPAFEEHGGTGMELASRLAVWVSDHGLGRAYLAETGFILQRDPDTLRAPDCAFIAKDRVPERRGAFCEVVPDLVLEVVSESDRAGEVMEKIGMWLEAGVKVVWVLWPDTQTLQVWRGLQDMRTLSAADALTCEDLLPGFELPLERVFE